MKKGFTLTEVIGVIVLLAALSLFLIPVVDKQLKDSKNKLYRQQIKNIELAAQLFYEDLPTKLDKNEQMMITLSQLKLGDYADKNLMVPNTDELFPNDMKIEIKNEEGVVTYHVLEDTGSDRQMFDGNTPILKLNGNAIVYVNLNDPNGYIDLGAQAKVGSKTITVTSSNTGFDISNPGVYTYTYQATNEGKNSYLMRTVIVKDLEAPMISFDETVKKFTTTPTNEQLLSDITVTDNSNETIVATVETNFSSLEGTYTVKYIAKDSAGNERIILRNIQVGSVNLCSVPVGTVYNFEYTGAVQNFVTTCAGKYKLEVWGAQGGIDAYAGKGGYSLGTITLNKNTNVFIYTGQQGITNAYSVAFNGGGAAKANSERGGGGGASDIRIETDSLYARVIVAGGGGGGAGTTYGGAGGGLLGISGNSWNTTVPGDNNSTAGGMRGSQIAAGQPYSSWVGTNIEIDAAFGIGGSSKNSTTIAGGGGGWYGGACGNAGGGGSGWVYTSANFSTWQSGNATDANQWLLNSNYYLTDASTVAGNTSFTDPNGTTVTGHSGNGYARITYLGQ